MGAASRQRTLSELWKGIVLESRVGHHLGAVAVRVVVDGDRDIASVFAATEYPEGSAAPARLHGSMVSAEDTSPLTTTVYTHPSDQEMAGRVRGLAC